MPPEIRKTKKELLSEIEILRNRISELESRSGQPNSAELGKLFKSTEPGHQENPAKDFEFSDLFDIGEIQQIQDAFSDATGVASIITYPDGKPITRPSNFCRLCNDIIRKTDKGCANCYTSDAIIGRFNPSGPIVQPCLSGGLWDAGASIRVGDRHIANWLIGQVRNEAIDECKILAYAKEIGADEEEFQSALSEVTIMPIEQFKSISHALFLIANQMSRIAFQNARLQEAIAVRDRTELSLRESQTVLRQIFDSIPDAIIVVDRQGIIVDVNPVATELTGYSKDDLLTMVFSDVVAKDNLQEAASHLMGIMKIGKSDGELAICRKDGLRRDVFMRGVKISEDYILGYGRDITDQKRVNKILVENEERFRGLFDHMSSGVAVYEAVENGRDFIFKDFNRAGERIEKVSKQDIIGRRVTEVFPGVKDFGLLDVLRNVWTTGRPRYHPIALYKDKNLQGWRENYVLRLGSGEIVAVYDDVTERKLTENRLLASEERFRLLMEQSPFAIEIYGQDGTMAQANKAWERLWNIPDRTRFVGTYNILADAQARAIGYSEAITNAFKGKSTDIAEAVYNPRLSGNPGRHRYLHSSIYPLFDDKKEIINAVMIHEDITARKEVAQERESLIGELEAKNAELERFTYTVSHDLKSPLITIRGFLGMLKKDVDAGSQDRVEDDIQRIGNAADKMHALLDDVLRLSRIGRIVSVSERVSLKQLTAEVIELLNGPIRQKDITVRVSDDLPELYGDRVRLHEVMQNLIENAVKFIGSNEQPVIEIGVRTEGQQPVCYVKDNGIGIDPKFHDKVFDLFDQLNQDVEGTGVGLAMVKRIIETHGGRVWVESQGVGRGSTFCFTIPPQGYTIYQQGKPYGQ